MRHLWTLCGGLALALGVIGIFLPLLPTVPFLLLAAFCFARGSRPVHDWLLAHPRLGPPIADWRAHGAIRAGAKRAAIIAMAVTLGVSLVLGVSWLVLGIQIGVLACVATFILTRPSGGR